MKKYLKNKYLILLIASFVSSVLVLVYFLKSTSLLNVYEVTPTNIKETIQAEGIAISSEDIALGFERDGIVKDIYVKNNDQVQDNTLLAELKDDQLKAQLQKQEAKINLLKAQLTKLLSGISPKELDFYKAQVESARADLNKALNLYENTKIEYQNQLDKAYLSAKELSEPILIATSDAMDILNSIYEPSNKFKPFFFIPDISEKSDAEWQIIFTKDAYKKINSLIKTLKETPISNHQKIDQLLTDIKINLEVIRVALDKTTIALKNSSSIPPGKPIDEYKTDLKRAKAGLNSAQTEILNQEQNIKIRKDAFKSALAKAEKNIELKRAELKKKEKELILKEAGPTKEEISLKQAEIKNAEAEKKLILKKIELSKLISPVEGLISEIKIQKNSLYQKEKPAFIISPTNNIQIKAKIKNGFERYIKVGNKVKIKSKNTDKIIDGKVIKISDKYAYIIPEKDQSQKIKLKDNFSVSIETNIKDNAILIPKDAIKKDTKGDYVIIFSANTKMKRYIQIGEYQKDGLIEVLQGLYPKEKIIIN